MNEALALIEQVPHAEQEEVYRALSATLDAHYRDHWYDWLCEQVVTRDEASQQILPWPKDLVYLREVAALIEAEPALALPKSRRMKATWLVAAYCVHRARYFDSNAIYIQSEKEEKAAYVVDKRCAFIEDHLEPIFRRKYHALRTGDGLIGRLTYEKTGSYLWAIPEGADKVRAFTPSILVMDESEFQPQGYLALGAALALQEKSAKVIMISSSNGPQGVMAGLCREAGFVRHTG